MAEEKIVLTIDDGYCATKCEYFPIACSAECEHIDKPTFSYTRQEAIERMAKALAFVQAKTFVNKDQWEIVMRGCRYEAEATLNALLEDE